MCMPRMITIRQAADETGLSYDAVRKMCVNNEIVHIRAGKKYLINADKLEKYLNGGEEENGRQTENMRSAAAGTAGNEEFI